MSTSPAPSALDRLDRVVALVRRHRPALRLVDKHDVLSMRALSVLAWPFMPTFMDDVTTVIGDTVYLPCPPDAMGRELLAQVLAHELVHQLDQAAAGVAFYVGYVALPLPVGRTWRAHYERRAYAVDLALAYERDGQDGLERVAEVLVERFAGASYAWMWAGREAAREYLRPVVEQVRSGRLEAIEPYREILAAWRGERRGGDTTEREGRWR